MVSNFAAEVASIKQRLRALEIAPRLASASLEGASIPSFDRDGNLKAIIGQQPDGSHTVVVVDGPTPLQPTDPVVEGGVFSAKVTWDGNLIGPFGAVDAELDAYADFQICEVLAGDSDGFVPSEGTDEVVGGLGRQGGTTAVPLPEGTSWIRLRIRSQAGKVGPPSPAVPVTVEALVDQAQFDQIRADLDEASLWITETGIELENRLGQAETDLDQAESNLADAQTALDTAFPSGAFGVADQITAEAAAAKAAAEVTAALDAAAKADAARVAAIQAAAADAEAKANAAKAAAEQAAQQYADGAISASQATVLSQAATTAQEKADAAKQEALTAAAIDAQNKASDAAAAAEAAAKAFATGEADAAELAAKQAAATDAQAKADAAKAAAISAAAADATTKANNAQALAKQYTDGQISTVQTSINGLNITTYTDIAAGAAVPGPPSTSGRRPGDIHRVRREDTGVIEKEWTLNPSKNWVVVYYGDAILTSLDVGKLVAGSANIDTAVINKMAVGVASVIELDVERLRAGIGTLDTAVINKLWTDVVRSRKITTDMLIVGKGENLIPWNPAAGVEPHLAWSGTTVLAADDADVGWCIEVLGGTGTDGTFANAIGLRSGQVARNGMEGYFDVDPGKSYLFRVGVGVGGTMPTSTTREARALVQFYDAAGTYITGSQTYSTPVTGNVYDANVPYIEFLVEAPANAAAMTLYVQKTWWSTGSLFLVNASLRSATDASLIVDGTIEGRHVNALSVAAELGEFITVKANNIQGGVINAALKLGTSGSLQVGEETSPHVYVANGKVESRLPTQGGQTIATATMGGSDNAFGAYDNKGTLLGGIETDGRMSTPELSADAINLAGSDLAELLNTYPGGAVVWTPQKTTTYGPYSSRTGVWEFMFPGVGGRRYEIKLSFQATSTLSQGYIRTGLTKTQGAWPGWPDSAPPSVSAPRIDSPQFTAESLLNYNNTGAGGWRDYNVSYFYKPSVGSTELARFLWYIDSSTASYTVSVRNFNIIVIDHGPNPDNEGRASLGGASGTTPPSEPPVQDYDKQWYFTGHEVWTQFGRGDTYASEWVRSGNYKPAFDSVYRTYMLIPSTAASALAGSTATKGYIRLNQVSGFTDQPWIGYITTTNITTSEPSTIYEAAQLRTWKKGQNQWAELPATIRNAIASGSAKGIVIGRKSAVTNQDFSGTGAGSSVRPKLRMVYSK